MPVFAVAGRESGDIEESVPKREITHGSEAAFLPQLRVPPRVSVRLNDLIPIRSRFAASIHC